MQKRFLSTLAAALLMLPLVSAADYIEIGSSGTAMLNRPYCGS